jgi:hypothetical protein
MHSHGDSHQTSGTLHYMHYMHYSQSFFKLLEFEGSRCRLIIITNLFLTVKGQI